MGDAVITLNGAGIALLQSWIDNPGQNNGIVIQNYEDANTDDLDFVSNEGSNPLTRPKLSIDFLPASAAGYAPPDYLASFMQNADNPYDVNVDEQVSPMDALIIINTQNGIVPTQPVSAAERTYPDPSGDTVVSPLDALLVINYLNLPADVEFDPDLDEDLDDSEQGEGEGLSYELYVTPTGSERVSGGIAGASAFATREDSEPSALFSIGQDGEDPVRAQTQESDSARADDLLLSTEIESALDAICEDLAGGSAADGLVPDDAFAAFFARLGTDQCDDDSR
jgi:hypothetical protein